MMLNRTRFEMDQDDPVANDELRRRWKAGKLQRHLPHLWKFVLDKRSYLTSSSKSRDETWTLFINLIQSNRSICVEYESRDQAKEITNELWYAGERGLREPIHVILNWAEKHGRNWRDWRTREYLFAAEMCKEQILRTIHPC